MRKLFVTTIVMLAMVAMITGCDDEKPRVQAVEKYINQLKQDAQNSKQPVSEVTLQFPKSTEYGEAENKNAKKDAKIVNGTLVNPLLAYPANKYQFVGILNEDDRLSAYLLAPDGLIYQVKEGDAIGNNYGKISKIDSDHLTVIEQTTEKNKKEEQKSITLELKEDKDDQS
jgi:Tfp pilus assembly protein PilP